MILGTCAKCGRPIPAGQRYCAEHKRELTQRHTAKTREYGYRRKNWRQVREQRLNLAGHICELKLPGCTTRATHVHLDPGMRGQHDAATLNDCRACCASCSGAVDAPRSHAAR
jgi:hypothetical protein